MERQGTNSSEITGYSTVADAQMNRQDFNVNLEQGKRAKPMPVKKVCLYFTIWQAALLSVCVVGLFFGAYRVYGPVEHSHQDCDPRNSKVRLSIHCLVPVAPNNSKLIEETKSNFTIGEETSFHCVHGYHLIGNGKLTCVTGGQWLQEGFCINKENRTDSCKAPQRPNNTHIFEVLNDNNDAGDEIDFQCMVGYQLIGDGKMVCVRNGIWRQAGYCRLQTNIAEKCSTPATPHNATFIEVLRTNYILGDIIEYQCDTGYKVTGDGKMACTEGNQWRQFGHCCLNESHSENCNAPSEENHTRLLQPSNDTSYALGDEIDYQCMVGYQLVGIGKMVCARNGIWRLAGYCRIQTNPQQKCVAPIAPNNANFTEVLETNYTPGDEIDYHCNTGYHLSGYGKMVCTKDNQWRQVSHCQRNENKSESCKTPLDKNTMYFSEVLNDTFNIGDEIDFQCVVGYQIIGDGKMVCIRNGIWRQSGYCRLRTNQMTQCDAPIAPDNARFSEILQPNYSPGDEIGYECDTAYQPTGDGKMVCTGCNRWRQLGRCRQNNTSCHPPNDTVSGIYQPVKERYNESDTIWYSCKNGYAVEGNSVLTCLKNGTWNSPSPNCTVIDNVCESTTWTQFFNLHLPDEEGDYETIADAKNLHPTLMCSGNVTAIDVRSVVGAKVLLESYAAVRMDRNVGFWCINAEQPQGESCSDYSVRFCCE